MTDRPLRAGRVGADDPAGIGERRCLHVDEHDGHALHAGALCDRVPVPRPEEQRSQNQDLEGALKKLQPVHR